MKLFQLLQDIEIFSEEDSIYNFQSDTNWAIKNYQKYSRFNL